MSLIFYLMVKSFLAALICFFAGILVDIDHLFEYIKDTGWDLNPKHFFKYCYEAKYEQLYLLFHAFEYLPLIVIIIVTSDYNLLIIAAGIGYTQHLLFDQATNPVRPMTYFIFYRVKNRFSKRRLLKDDFFSSLS